MSTFSLQMLRALFLATILAGLVGLIALMYVYLLPQVIPVVTTTPFGDS